MFKGRAVFKDPESGATVGTFTETCEHNGTTKVKVVIREAITLEGTQTLEVFGTVKDQAVISVTAKNGAATKIQEFGGTSTLGCLPDKMDVALVRSPGGELGTLLVVLGKGTIHPDHG